MAVYQDVAETLEQEIRQTLTCGDYLPSEAELARRFAINRHTLRRAVDQLVDAGMLLRQHGKGTLVVEHCVEYNIGARARFSESLEAMGHASFSEVIGRRVLVADERLSRASGIPAGTPILQVDTLRSMNGRPVNLICHYLRRQAFPGLELDYRGGSLHAHIENHHGIRLLRQQALIGTTLPSQREAELLQYPRHMPVLVVKSNNVRAGTDEVLEYSVSRGRADCFEFRIQPRTNDLPTGETNP
jgi:GntR family phosphonate transport system transcriptional regulator